MSGCCVNGCTNRYSTKGLKFHRIPTGSRPFQKNRRRLWLQAIKRVDWSEDIKKNARVCSAHFISGEASLDYSSPDFVPSVFVYTKQSQNPKANLERYHRKRRRDDRPITAANLCVPSKTPEQECSMDHCPGKPAYEMEESNPDWAPSLNLGHSEVTKSDQHTRRIQRTRRRAELKNDHTKAQPLIQRRDAEHEGQPAYESLERDPDWTPSLHLGHSKLQFTDAAKRDKQRQPKTNKLQMAEVTQIIKELQNKEEATKTQATNTTITSSAVQNVCCVVNCDSTSHDAQGNRLRNGPSFYCFPAWRRSEGSLVSEVTKRRRDAWVAAVARTDIRADNVPNAARICSKHFVSGQPANESLERDPDWTPSLHLGHSKLQSTDAAKRDKRRKPKTNKLQMAEVAQIIGPQNKEEATKTQATNTTITSSAVKNVCCVVNCDSTSHDAQGNRVQNGQSFYCFPAWRRSEGFLVSEVTKRRREAWVAAVAGTDIRADNVPNAARICSKHFVSGKPAYEMLETDPDWAPSLNLNDKKMTKPGQKLSKSLRHATEDPQTHTGGAPERPDVMPWKDLKSRLQSLMEDKSSSAQPTEDMETTELDFKDFFRSTLQASLEACIGSRPQRTPETRPTVDRNWFSPDKAFVYKKPTSAPPSTVDCENCVRLKECLVELEKRLIEDPIEQNQDQTDPDYSEWMEPLSQTELNKEQATVEDHSSSSSSSGTSSNRKTTSFQLSWIKKHWFLRYSPKLNVMWCHVCRLYAGKPHRKIAFVVGSKTFYQCKIIQHSNTGVHKQSVKRFKSDEKLLQE